MGVLQPSNEGSMRALYLSIRDDTSLMDDILMPMALKQYSLRDFDVEGLAEMAEAEMENNAETAVEIYDDPPL